MRLNGCRYWWMWARISSSIHLYWICGFWYRRRSLHRIVWGTSSRRQSRVTWRRVVAISMCLLIVAATLSPKPLRQSNPIAKTTKPQSSWEKTWSLKTTMHHQLASSHNPPSNLLSISRSRNTSLSQATWLKNHLWCKRVWYLRRSKRRRSHQRL